MVAITVNKNVWGYGFAEFIIPWVLKAGFVPPISSLLHPSSDIPHILTLSRSDKHVFDHALVLVRYSVLLLREDFPPMVERQQCSPDVNSTRKQGGGGGCKPRISAVRICISLTHHHKSRLFHISRRPLASELYEDHSCRHRKAGELLAKISQQNYGPRACPRASGRQYRQERDAEQASKGHWVEILRHTMSNRLSESEIHIN
jgi:hypothetical protein